MDREAAGPAVHYYMIRGGSEKKNITVIEAGFAGAEYIKTYGHYHVDDFVEIYTVLYGQGLVLLQMREKDADGAFEDDRIVKFEAIQVKAGDSVTIPPFAGHLLVNTGPTWLVTSDNSPVSLSGDSAGTPKHADYAPVKKMQGFAYYVVNSGGKPSLVKNPRYAFAPPAILQ